VAPSGLERAFSEHLAFRAAAVNLLRIDGHL
jgi:hypothetical protein